MGQECDIMGDSNIKGGSNMENNINISLDLSPLVKGELDLRVPNSLTVKELIETVSEAYGLSIVNVNPWLRDKQTGRVLASTSTLEQLKNGDLLQLESL